jgi:hypothetical protein
MYDRTYERNYLRRSGRSYAGSVERSFVTLHEQQHVLKHSCSTAVVQNI